MKLRTERLRKFHEENLTDSCNIRVRVPISDGMGGDGYGDSWPIIDPNVPCRIAPFFGSERIIGYTIDPIKDVMFLFQRDYVINEEYRVEHDGKDFEITYVIPQRTFETMKRVICRELSSDA